MPVPNRRPTSICRLASSSLVSQSTDHTTTDNLFLIAIALNVHAVVNRNHTPITPDFCSTSYRVTLASQSTRVSSSLHTARFERRVCVPFLLRVRVSRRFRLDTCNNRSRSNVSQPQLLDRCSQRVTLVTTRVFSRHLPLSPTRIDATTNVTTVDRWSHRNKPTNLALCW